jgi:hypothetical protein
MGASKSKITSKPGTQLSAIKSQLRPLDLIVFRGSGFVSDAIVMVEKLRLGSADWSHVGMVVTTDLIPIKNGKPGELYIWESTMSGELSDGVNNVETGKGTFGVQIRNLADVIDKYDASVDSRIGWCALLNNPTVRRPDDSDATYKGRLQSVKETLIEFQSEWGNSTYDYNICRLCASVCDSSNTFSVCGVGDIFGRSDKLFCSELVATIYQLLGLLPADIDPEKISPEELLSDLPCPVQLPPVVITREWSKSQRVDL